MFYNVGMLREILKNYPDDISLYVGEAPGLVLFDEEQRWINLRNTSSDWDDYPEFENTTRDVDYLDF